MTSTLLLRIISVVALLQFVGHGTTFVRARATHGPDEVAVVDALESIDRTSAVGRRDYAMLLLIATYGLRSSEIVALTLDDFAWHRGGLRVPRRKVDGVRTLPLTDDAGAAVLDYIRHGRPTLPTRVLFLRVCPPAGLLKPTAVTEVFQACARHSGLTTPFQGPLATFPGSAVAARGCVTQGDRVTALHSTLLRALH